MSEFENISKNIVILPRTKRIFEFIPKKTKVYLKALTYSSIFLSQSTYY